MKKLFWSGCLLFGIAHAQEADLRTWSLDDKIGQLFMVGFKSPEQVEKLRPGGVVLFSWNMKSVVETRALTRELRALARDKFKRPLFIATDHEGGQVLRLRRGLTNFPDGAAVGATRDPYLAFKVGKAMGQELSALGVNMNLAPVMDLGNARSFLQNRIWGDQGGEVGAMTTAFIHGLQAARVLAVGKHFPGHGRSTVDAHFALPRLLETEKQIWSEDLEPFKEASNQGLQAVMTAHVEIPAIDSVPASLSGRFITGILRQKIGFKGLVLTDDLEMGGVQAWGNAGDVAVRALKAGSDMVLIVWSEDLQQRVLARIKGAIVSGELSEAFIDEKVRRILNVKRQYLAQDLEQDENPFWQQNLMTAESIKLTDLISKKAVSWVGGDFEAIMQSLARDWKKTWTVFLPSVAARQNWQAFRSEDRVIVNPRRPDDQELKRLGENLDVQLKAPGPFLVMTGPRASSSEEVFQLIRGRLSQLQRRPASESVPTVVWVHQGGQPVEIRSAPQSLRMGLVSLHTSSKKGVEAFMNLIKEGTARFSSLQSRNEHGSQFR